MKQAISRYHEFIRSTPKPIRKLDSDSIQLYIHYLSDHSSGCGAYSTYARFKKAITAATRKGVLKSNPCSGLRCPHTETIFQKDTLSEIEISRLTHTPMPARYGDIRKAFLLCLYSGMRFCDVKTLRHKNIDLPNRILHFSQSKTQDRSSKAIVYIPIREDMLSLLNLNPDMEMQSLVYNLPSHPTCLKILREWTQEAGIKKHITWHCARHSFATNLLKNGADIKVVADLLGHSSLKYVEIYTRATDSRKIKAINSLAPFVLDAGIQQTP